MNNSKKCTKCNLEFPIKYKFCTECGQELKMMNICKGCSAPLNKASKFCSNCGASTNPNKAVTVVKHVHVPYSASKDESTEEDSSEKCSDKAKETEPIYSKNIKIGVFIFLGFIFLLFLIAGEGASTVYNEDPSSFMNNRYYDPNTGTWYFLP